MGVGYVPAGSVCQECEGDDLPRCQHRGAGADFGSLSRRDLGALGERLAAVFLNDRGADILDRNVSVGRGELDLIVSLGGTRVAVEVKTATGDFDPVFHFDEPKQEQVRSLAAQLGIHRVDFVGILVGPTAAQVRWLPAVG